MGKWTHIPQISRKRQRDASTLYGMQITGGHSRVAPRRDQRRILAVYRESPILRSIAKKIAETVAMTEWYTVYVRDDGTEVEIPMHPMSQMMNQGTLGLTGTEARRTEELHMLLSGDSFSIIDYNIYGFPVRRTPIPPHWVAQTPLPTQAEFLINPTINGGKTITLPRKQVIWMKDPDPENPYGRGTGSGLSLDDEINADEASAKHIANSLMNRARPELVVSGSKEAPLNETDRDRLEDVWVQKFGGPSNAGKPFISRGPIEVKPITPTFKDLDLTSLRGVGRDIMIQHFGMPPEIMGVIANSNRSTIDAAEYLFLKYVICPRLVARQEAYNDQVAPQYMGNVQLRYRNPIKADREEVKAVMDRHPECFTIDEIRAHAGHAPLPGGLGRRIPMRMDTEGIEVPEMPDQNVTSRPAMIRSLDASAVERYTGLIPATPIQSALMGIYNSASTEFYVRGLSLAGAQERMPDSTMAGELASLARERSELITATTKKMVKEYLESEQMAGVTDPRRVTKMAEEFIRINADSRAQAIASNEVVLASNVGLYYAFKDSGVPSIMWNTLVDGSERATHRAMDGQVVPVGDKFVSPSGASTRYPGGFGVSEEDINCRCVVTPEGPVVKSADRRDIVARIDAARNPHEIYAKALIVQAFEVTAEIVRDRSI